MFYLFYVDDDFIEISLELNLNQRPDVYTGVEGRVIQAQGLHVAHVAQLYCRIKILG